MQNIPAKTDQMARRLALRSATPLSPAQYKRAPREGLLAPCLSLPEGLHLQEGDEDQTRGHERDGRVLVYDAGFTPELKP